MKLSFLFSNILIIFNSLTYSRRIYKDPILLVAKCGYHCWPKYAEDAGEVRTHDKSVKITDTAVNKLDDYQIGALRGCMEECFIREIDSDVYPPLSEPSYSPWSHSIDHRKGVY